MVKRNANRILKFKLQKALVDKNIIDKRECIYDETEEKSEKEIFNNIILTNLE